MERLWCYWSQRILKIYRYRQYDSPIDEELKRNNNIEFFEMNVPPLDFEANTIDFVVTFQVIEHINDDKKFIKEIHRVLKPGGKLILTTPNRLMSLSRNPWHVREYSPIEMREILNYSFNNINIKGVFGNEKVMKYYNENKNSEKILKENHKQIFLKMKS